jgi:hypothetical protein
VEWLPKGRLTRALGLPQTHDALQFLVEIVVGEKSQFHQQPGPAGWGSCWC